MTPDLEDDGFYTVHPRGKPRCHDDEIANAIADWMADTAAREQREAATRALFDDDIAAHARNAEYLTPEDTMKMETRQYWPDHEAPDYGGLQGRFARMWTGFNARPLSRVSVWSLMMIGALAGVAAAAWVAL